MIIVDVQLNKIYLASGRAVDLGSEYFTRPP